MKYVEVAGGLACLTIDMSSGAVKDGRNLWRPAQASTQIWPITATGMNSLDLRGRNGYIIR